MTKSSKDENFVQTFDFAGKTITLEDAEPLSDDEQDNFIEFKASEKIPEIHVEGDDEGPARGEWGNKLDFLFSCISVSVGLGNVWRFPYLCYKNGGGAFLIVYFTAMTFCGIPIFFQEVAIGQYLGSGGMTLVAQLCPMLKGVGIATMTVVGFLDIYYCVIIAWTFFYLFATYSVIPDLPWATCEGWWNTKACFKGSENITENSLLKKNFTAMLGHNKTTTSVEEFWEHRVLQQNAGLEHGLGGMQWELAGCLVIAWVVVYLIIAKGLHSSGKIIWFTALFPYFVMFILLGRALTLPGAFNGLWYYVHVDWSKLLDGETWIDGATQIFFAYSVGMGALPALGSYNKFHHDCFRDAIITCIVNTLTCLLAGVLVFSILGYMAFITGSTIHDVVNSGPGLVFLTYPDLVLSLPGSVIWATIFFVMLLVLGIDSEFCNVEALVTGIVDNWPDQLLKHRRKFTIALCFGLFCLGLPLCTNGGIYMFQLLDFYSCSGLALLWVTFFQTIAIGWFFGAQRFCDCIEQMTGHKPNIFWYLCWKYFAPLVMFCVFIFYIVSFKPVKLGSYEYPGWAEGLGLCFSFASMMWVPGYAIYYLLTQPGTFMQNLRSGLAPNMNLRKEAKIASKLQQNLKEGFTPNIKRMQTLAKPGPLHVSESGVGLLTHNNSEYEMGNLRRDESF